MSADGTTRTRADRIWSALVRRDTEAEAALPAPVAREVPANGLRQVAALTLQSSGDQAVNASTVLPWLFHTLGVPAALSGLLVPIRESGSMLPQVFLTPLVLRARRRAPVFVLGALVQAVAVAVMVLTAALGSGLGAGVVVLAALAVFSLGRSLGSIASKDVQGRTVPKGERGQINGLSTTASGIVAISLGLAIRVFGGEELSAGQLAWLLAGGAACWLAVALVYSRVREPAGEPERTDRDEVRDDARGPGDGSGAGAPPAAGELDRTRGGLRDVATLLRQDATFRSFVVTRSFLLVSSLSPPFIVTLSLTSGTDALAGLGGFVLASGVASLVGGRTFGRLADRSSRRLMTWAAAAASVVILALLVLARFAGPALGATGAAALFLVAYLLVSLLHTGVRVGRKTYVVDIAEGDLRTTYVAVSNSAMGAILLVVGGLSSLLALAGPEWALAFLALLGVVGVVSGAKLPEVERG